VTDPATGVPLGITRFTAAQHPAFEHQIRPGRAMDRPINTAAAQKRAICSIDDRINCEGRDVRLDGSQYGYSHMLVP